MVSARGFNVILGGKLDKLLNQITSTFRLCLAMDYWTHNLPRFDRNKEPELCCHKFHFMPFSFLEIWRAWGLPGHQREKKGRVK